LRTPDRSERMELYQRRVRERFARRERAEARAFLCFRLKGLAQAAGIVGLATIVVTSAALLQILAGIDTVAALSNSPNSPVEERPVLVRAAATNTATQIPAREAEPTVSLTATPTGGRTASGLSTGTPAPTVKPTLRLAPTRTPAYARTSMPSPSNLPSPTYTPTAEPAPTSTSVPEPTALAARPEPVPIAASWVAVATYYSWDFAGQTTALGEIFQPTEVSTACHQSMLKGWYQVTNLANGNSVVVRCNDTGPFRWTGEEWEHLGRERIDLSEAAFSQIAPIEQGVIRVRVAPVAPPGRT
jgi:rare lipoprotein A (peptidoglycan hydrolase)